MILVSACLVGYKCRYDGTSKDNDLLIDLVKSGKAIPICPEMLSGLSTPRKPLEQKNDRVINIDGEDYTERFILGASYTLELANKYDCKIAILKSKSSTCGVEKIYDGTFTSTLTNGYGITAKYLKNNGIEVISSDDTNKIKEIIDNI